MDLLTPIVSTLSSVVVVISILVLITWSRLIRWRFRQPICKFMDQDSLPPDLTAVFQSAEQRLIPLGFRYSHAVLQEDPVIHIEQPQAIQVFVHEQSQTYAEVSPALSPEAGVLFNVAFVTVLLDGHAIVTVDCLLHTLPPRPTWCHISDYYVGSVERQWEEHQRHLQKTAALYVLKPCSAHIYLEHNQRFLRELITRNPLLTTTAKSKEWRMQLLPAIRFSWQMLLGHLKSARVRRALQKAKRKEPAATVVPTSHVDAKSYISSEVAAFERMQELQDKVPGWSRMAKGVLLLISIAVAGVSFGLSLDPSFVVILLGVLFFHELGHWFGMWLFDYRDRQMFFIPFLGAAVTGDKEDATPMQQIIVALLGPLPGLILGVACLHWAPTSDKSLLTQVGLMAVSLNYLNLLPVNPLDGGRVVDILLSRFPWLRFAFGLISVLLLFLAGLSGMRLVTGIAVAMMFTLISQWRVNIALRRLRKLSLSLKNRSDRLKAIFQILTQAPFHQQAANTRYELAKSLLRHLTTGPANWRTMCFGGSVYALTLLLPLYPVYMAITSTMATVHEQVAIMDTRCVPEAKLHRVKTQPLQDLLAEHATEEPAILVQRIAGHMRTKIPCVADYKTYDLALLNSDERMFWDLYWFHMKVTIGGFRQYFENDATKASTLRIQLERIGAKNSLQLFERSLAAFPDKRIPDDPQAIKDILRHIDEASDHPAHALWEELEQEYSEQHANEFNQQLLAYVRAYIADFTSPRTLAQASTQQSGHEKLVEVKPSEVKPAPKKFVHRH